MKLVNPRSTVRALRSSGLPGSPPLGRFLGLVELAIAFGALVQGGRLSASLVAASYLGFALFTFRLLVLASATPCGCFGEKDAPATRVHVALNITAAVAAALAAGWPPGPLPSVVASQPLAGVPFLALVALLAWLAYVSLTFLPQLSLPDDRATPNNP